MLRSTILTAMLTFGANVLAAPAAEAAPAPEANPAPILDAASSLVARKGEYLGGIDMDAYCRSRWGSFAYADLRDSSCNGWKCNIAYPTVITGISVDVNEACSEQHGVSAYGWCTSGSNGWGCYKN